MPVAHFFPAFFDNPFGEVVHVPVGFEVCHFKKEVFDHGCTVKAVVHFRMELQSVDFAFFIAHGGNAEGRCFSAYVKTLRGFAYFVAVTHPHAGAFAKSVPKRAFSAKFQFGRSVFTCFRLGKFTAEIVRQKLHAVANAKHRHTDFKQSHIQFRSVFFADACRSAG